MKWTETRHIPSRTRWRVPLAPQSRAKTALCLMSSLPLESWNTLLSPRSANLQLGDCSQWQRRLCWRTEWPLCPGRSWWLLTLYRRDQSVPAWDLAASGSKGKRCTARGPFKTQDCQLNCVNKNAGLCTHASCAREQSPALSWDTQLNRGHGVPVLWVQISWVGVGATNPC